MAHNVEKWLSRNEVKEMSLKAEDVINNNCETFERNDWLSLAIFAIDQAAESLNDPLMNATSTINEIRLEG